MSFGIPSAFFVLCLIAAFPTVQGAPCELKAGGTELVCAGIDDHPPNALDANIQAAFPLSSPPDIRTKVTWIQVITSRGGNVTINEHTFQCFPNLIALVIAGHFEALDPMVNVHPRAFRHTPALTKLHFFWIGLSDGTVETIASLKDQLGTLHVMKVRPMDKIVPHLASFTGLRDLHLGDLGGEDICSELVPSDIIS